MTILAFDTSTPRICAAIDGSKGSAELDLMLGTRHQESILAVLETLCGLADTKIEDIEALVCGRGPGSFTGLRVGMACAKAMSLALSCPLVSVSALDAIAHGLIPRPVRSQSPILLPVIDGKKSRFYGTFYFEGKRLCPSLDLDPLAYAEKLEELGQASRDVLICGPDAFAFFERAQKEAPRQSWHYVDASSRPWGRSLLELGRERILAGNWDTPDSVPDYVRASDAELGLSLQKSGN